MRYAKHTEQPYIIFSLVDHEKIRLRNLTKALGSELKGTKGLGFLEDLQIKVTDASGNPILTWDPLEKQATIHDSYKTAFQEPIGFITENGYFSVDRYGIHYHEVKSQHPGPVMLVVSKHPMGDENYLLLLNPDGRKPLKVEYDQGREIVLDGLDKVISDELELEQEF